MTTTRRFNVNDLLTFNGVNLDRFTETFNMPFYLDYLARWPDACATHVSPGGHVMSYMIGKVEGEDADWHGHVTAVSVAPEYRRIGDATRLMNFLEHCSQELYNAYFVDLYVRASNAAAISLYIALGYTTFRVIEG